MDNYKIILSSHAINRLFARGIDPSLTEVALSNGSIINTYPEDKPYPSRLILYFHDNQPIHIVAADDNDNKLTYIITVYIPDPARWNSDFTKRRL
jgi:hypothetical protein